METLCPTNRAGAAARNLEPVASKKVWAAARLFSLPASI